MDCLNISSLDYICKNHCLYPNKWISAVSLPWYSTSNRPLFVCLRPKGYNASKVKYYANSTSTFNQARLTLSGDIASNPGPEISFLSSQFYFGAISQPKEDLIIPKRRFSISLHSNHCFYASTTIKENLLKKHQQCNLYHTRWPSTESQIHQQFCSPQCTFDC